MIPDTNSSRAADAGGGVAFQAPYAPPDEAIAAGLLDQASGDADGERRIDAYAARLIEGIRSNAAPNRFQAIHVTFEMRGVDAAAAQALVETWRDR